MKDKISALKDDILVRIDKILIPVTIVAVIIAVITNVFSFGTVQGTSMIPTLNDGDMIISIKHVTPKDGDIIVIDTSKLPDYKNNSATIIKRYYADKSTDGYYVLGDNSQVSYDSRYFGEVPKEAVKCVTLFKFRFLR